MNILKIAKRSMRGRSHLLACVCFILSIVLCLMGGISYSKYITAQNNNANGTIGSFVCDAGIDGVSATTFAYSDFWSYNSATDSYLQMNALRTLNFTVKNYTGTGASQKISEVALRYHLSFTAPAIFAGELAIQLFDKNGDAETPIMPQISLSDLMSGLSSAGSSKEFNTASQDSYSATEFTAMTFTVTHKAGGVVEAVQKGAEDPIVITITPKEVTSERTISLRLWDVSALTTTGLIVDSDSGKLCAPLQIDYAETATYYSIAVSHPDFTITPGAAKEREHALKLVPVHELSDTHIEKYAADLTGNPLKRVYTGQSIMLKNTNTAGDTAGRVDITILRAWQLPEDATEPTEFTLGAPLQLYSGDRQMYYLSQCYSKNYPLSVDVDFEQILR